MIILLIIWGCFCILGCWYGVVWRFRRKRDTLLVQLQALLDRRVYLVKDLAEYVGEHIKSERIMCEEIITFCQTLTQKNTETHQRMILEAHLVVKMVALYRAVQKYRSIRTHGWIMEIQIMLSELESSIYTQTKDINTYTAHYNKIITWSIMRFISHLLKLEIYSYYHITDQELTG